MGKRREKEWIFALARAMQKAPNQHMPQPPSNPSMGSLPVPPNQRPSEGDQDSWRIARIFLWWSILMTSIIGLVIGIGSMQTKGILLTGAIGFFFGTVAIFEHKWKTWQQIIALVTVFGVTMGFGYSAWLSREVEKIRPEIVWSPHSLNAGDKLSDAQLNAMAFDRGKEIGGDWIYTPNFGTPAKETMTLSVQFISSNKGKYLDATKTVTLVVVPPPRVLQSIEDHDAFTFQIPFLISGMGDSRIDTSFRPKRDAAKGISELGLIARFPSQIDRAPSRVEMVSYLSSILEYYMCREIFVIQDPNPTPSISYDSNVGQTTHIEPVIDVPDPRPYSKSLWLSQVGSLGLNYNEHFAGPDDFSLPKNLRLPAGVNIKMIAEENNNGFTLRYARTPDLVFDLKVQFAATSEIVLPPRGPPPNSSQILNDVGVTVQSDFQWHGNPSNGEEYRNWAEHLVDGLKYRLAEQQPKQP